MLPQYRTSHSTIRYLSTAHGIARGLSTAHRIAGTKVDSGYRKSLFWTPWKLIQDTASQYSGYHVS
eukprot:951803-Rhodomonas_salina.1